MNKVKRAACHILQHISLVLGIVLLATALLSAYVRYETVYGVQSSYVGSDDRQGAYKDSELFAQLLREQAITIIRYGAIREQLETDGVFDPDKVIDVTVFANRYEGVPGEYVTAEYRLEDLIRWGKSGIEYLATYEVDEDFLNDTTTYTVISDEEFGNFMGKFNPYNSDPEHSVTKQDVTGNSLGQSSGDGPTQLLVNRYHTIEGKNIEDYVADWDAYLKLTENLADAIQDLGENYVMYEKLQAYYDSTGEAAESNMVYVIRKTVGDRTTVYTNLETKREDTAYLERLFKNTCDKYIYYDAQDMVFESNIPITEAKFRTYISDYSYAYPDDLQVMIGVRKELTAKDCFATTQQAYNNAIPGFSQNMIAAVICLLVFLCLFIYLTATEGAVIDKETKQKHYVLKAEDKIPTELFGAFALLVFGLLIAAIDSFFLEGSWLSELYSLYERSGVTLFVAGMVLLCSLCGSFFYYSLVRRIKAHMLWRGSLLRWCVSFVKKGWSYIQNHRSLVARVWIPYLIFAGLNILVMLLVAVTTGDAVVLILGIIILDALTGIVLYRNAKAREDILQVMYRICNGDLNAKVDEKLLNGDNLVLAKAVNRIGDSVRSAVETSMKDERLKADLITNVSHDLKTPLTSIINYVDLIRREQVENPRIQEYIAVLDAKSQRLKQLTEDLLEASKISSGNIVLHMERINLVELLNQTLGEFSEKFEQKGLLPVINGPSQPVAIMADGRRIYRVLENLFNNIFKYALEGTRIYIDLGYTQRQTGADGIPQAGVFISVKNISAGELNVAPEELTERFIRGDESRTTEGSGLGLSIAKNLTEAMNGTFTISIDGDLFKVIMVFPKPEP